MIQNRRMILRAIRGLFVPLASLLLKNRIDTQSVVVQLKLTFVDVAQRDHGIAGKPATVNGISTITGLSRQHVSSLLKMSAESAITDDLAAPIESSILTSWISLEKYQDDLGQPRPLEFGPGPNTFDELARDVTGSPETQSYLDKLLRSDSVEIRKDEKISLVKRSFCIGDDLPRTLSAGLTPLATTMDRNWGQPMGTAFPQHVAHSVKIASNKVNTLRRISREKIDTFLKEMDDIISSAEVDGQEDIENSEGTQLSRLGVGAYYFEIEK